MPAPTLTPQEIAQLQKDQAKQQGFADALTAAIPAKAAAAAQLAVSDGAFKKFFDYYNDQIIGEYNAERKAISGVYQAAPITEADIVGPATLDGSVRTTPTLPATDIVRVAEFDGGNTTTTTLNEQQAINDQLGQENLLQFGYLPYPTLNLTTLTASSLTGSSTSLDITDASSAPSFSIGQFFAVHSGTDSAIVKITSVTPGVGTPPPYLFTLGIQVIVPPTGTLSSGSNCVTFTGFTNAERTAKTATNVYFQNIMTFLIAALQSQINLRIARVNEQLTALAANQDPDGTAQIAAATTAANTSKTFLTNYLVTTDISDTGIGTLATERGTRGTFLTTRLSQITANYTGQTQNYYNQRYTMANNRGNTSRGTLRQQKAAEASSATLTSYAASAGDAASAIAGILP